MIGVEQADLATDDFVFAAGGSVGSMVSAMAAFGTPMDEGLSPVREMQYDDSMSLATALD